MFILSLHVRIRIFAPVLSRLRPAVVPSRPVRAEKNAADRTFPIYLHIHIYIYFFFVPCFVSTLYSNVDSRSTKYLESKIRNCSFCAGEKFRLTNLSALRISTVLSRVFFLAYLNSYKEIESCENSR